MEKLAAKLRYMQFYAHNAHNMCKGDTFFSDHEELGGLYGTYEGLYDSIVERMIGTGQTIDLVKVQTEAVKMLDSDATPTDFNTAFNAILTCEQDLCKLISDANEGASLGTQDLLQAMCNDSEVRQYKFQQRLSKYSAAKKETDSKEDNTTGDTIEEKKEATTKAKAVVVKLLTSKK